MTVYIPLQDAARRSLMTIEQLFQLINRDIINHATTTDGRILVDQDELDKLPNTDRPDVAQFEHLHGVAIGINQAAKKYGVSNQTISRWVSSGKISILGTGPRGMKLIDEAEAAYCCWFYNRAPGQGHRHMERIK